MSGQRQGTAGREVAKRGHVAVPYTIKEHVGELGRYVNRYGLTVLPEWTLRTKDTPGPDACVWSGKQDPPRVGEHVKVNFNGFGGGKVLAYFVELGWLGLHIEPDVLPDWFRKQEGLKHTDSTMIHVFGSEVQA